MKEDVNSARVIGVMSGSSLDGIDLALCHFAKDGKHFATVIEITRQFKGGHFFFG